MSSAARFLLEFEATGDQEVVNKIKAVGAAGKETATGLESLRGIEDPFEPIATGADAAVAPIEGVGTAAEGAVTPITDMGTATDETVSILSGAGTTAEEFGGAMEGVGTAADTAVAPLEGVGTAAGESLSIFSGAGTAVGDFSANLDAVGGAADAATGGLTPANTMMGNFAESTEGAGSSASSAAGNVGQFAGSITAMGGIIGSTIGTIFRMQDAQLRLDKANLRAAKATETARVAEQAFFDLLAKAPGNREAIAAATEAYITAQDRLTALQEAGITSGEEYEAAQAAVATTLGTLKDAYVEGGGSAADFDKKLNRMNLTQEQANVAAQTAAKALREQQEGMVDMAFNITSIVGTMAQFISGSKNMIDQAKKIGSAFGGLAGGLGGLISKLPTASGLLGEMGPIGVAIYDAFVLAAAGVKLFEGITAQAGGEAQKAADKYKEAFDFAKIFQAVGPNVQVVSDILKQFGVDVDADMKKSIEGILGVGKETKKTKDSVVDLGNGYSIVNNVLRKTSDIQKEAGTVTATLTSRFDEQNSRLHESRTLTEAQSAALNEVTGSALETAAGVAQAGEAIDRLTQADVQAITKLQEHTREQIIANAGYNNAKVAALQYQAALTAMTQSMVTDTDQKNANAQATLALVNTELNAQNAIATVNEEYANSVDRLADLNTVLGDNEARTKAVATVSNEFAASLKEQSIELEGTLQALQSVENQEQGVANAILQTKVSLEESNQALREAKAVHDDMGASSAQLQTALNEEQTALIEEEAALRASIASGNDSVAMRQRLDNAYLKGIDSIGQWTTELATAAEEEQGAIDALAELGFTFQDLPGYMEPTLENLKLVAEAQLGVGDAAEKMTDMAIENYNELTSASQGLADSIKDAFLEGDIEDAVQKAVDKIPPAVRKSMSDAQLEEYKGIQEMRATAEAAAIELGVDIDTEGFAAARADYTANLEDLASTTEGKWSEMWARAAEITKNGSEATVAAVKQVIEEGGGPELMLQKLNDIVPEMPGVGNKIGTALMNGVGQNVSAGGATLQTRFGEGLRGLTPAATKAGTDAGAALATGIGQSITSGGTTLQTRFGEGLRGLPPKAGTAGGQAGSAFVSEWDANVQLAGNALASIVKTASTLKVQIPITADVSAAHQAIAGLVTKAQSLVVTVTADVSPAHQAIAALVTQKPEPIIVTANTTQAVSALNAASTAALTMRNNFNAASSGVKSAVASAGAAVTSFSSKASSSFAKAGAAGTTMATRVKSASSNMKSSLSSAASSAASFASKCVSSFNKVGSSATSNASKVRSLASAINNLKSKTVTVRVNYVRTGITSFQHGGAFVVDKPTTMGGMKMGEHYKPELVTVTPLTNPNNLGDKTVQVNVPGHGGRAGGSREVVIPVTLMLDNKVLIRTVRRGLVEEVSGTM